jgi:hypothetical protein
MMMIVGGFLWTVIATYLEKNRKNPLLAEHRAKKSK